VYKRQALVVGNLLGSNLFNALMVGGTIGLIGGPALDDSSLTGLGAIAAVVVAAIALLVMVTGHTVTRRAGIALCLLSVGTCLFFTSCSAPAPPPALSVFLSPPFVMSPPSLTLALSQ